MFWGGLKLGSAIRNTYAASIELDALCSVRQSPKSSGTVTADEFLSVSNWRPPLLVEHAKRTQGRGIAVLTLSGFPAACAW